MGDDSRRKAAQAIVDLHASALEIWFEKKMKNYKIKGKSREQEKYAEDLLQVELSSLSRQTRKAQERLSETLKDQKEDIEDGGSGKSYNRAIKRLENFIKNSNTLLKQIQNSEINAEAVINLRPNLENFCNHETDEDKIVWSRIESRPRPVEEVKRIFNSIFGISL